MSQTDEQQSRREKAKEIANNPCEYAVCEGCDSIVMSETSMCPNCHGYRFDDAAERVVDQAVFLGAREQTSVTAEDLI